MRIDISNLNAERDFIALRVEFDKLNADILIYWLMFQAV